MDVQKLLVLEEVIARCVDFTSIAVAVAIIPARPTIVNPQA